MNRHLVSATFAASMAIGFAVAAQAQTAGLRVGMLTCDVSAGSSYGVGSSKTLNCLFSPSDGLPPEHYVGTVERYGFDVGVTGPGRLAWGVFTQTAYPGPGVLQGVYSGVSGGATIGAGATANYLVGGSNNAFSLQALSISSQTGLNVTAALGRMTLEFVPPPPGVRAYSRHHRRHHRHY